MGRLAAVVVVLVMALMTATEAQEGQSCRTKNGIQGTCGPIRGCPPLRNLLDRIRNKNAPPGSLQRLREAICSFNNNVPLVCCATSVSFPQPQPQPTSRPTTGGGGNILPSRCGISALTERIIDGEDAPLLAWPWMVLLRGKVNGDTAWFCGGALISDRYVLTAAHCLKSNFIQLDFVRIGEHTLSRSIDCERGLCAPPPQDIRVEQIVRHPQYGQPCNECNDIALLRLANSAVLNPLHVVPICLPQDPVREMGFSEAEYQGKFAWAAGWGTTSRNPSVSKQPDRLQQVQLPVQTLSYCQRLKKSYPDPRMTFCAGGDGRDTCRGDSGGPLTLSNNADTRRFLVGVTSLGPTVCGANNTQGLYTNVHYYVNWIISNMRP